VLRLVSDEGRRLAQSDYQPKGDLPVIDQGDAFISGYTDSEDSSYRGSLPVILFGDHTKRFKFVDFRFAVGAQGVKILQPREGMVPKYLVYLLRSLKVPDRGYSRHYQFLRMFRLPVAPEPEQHRILAEIEKQLTRLDAAVAALERARANLKRYRASVLKAAVEGRLVPTAGAWPTVSVEQLGKPGEQIVLTGPFGTSLGREDFQRSGVPVLTIGCLTEGGVHNEKALHVSEEKAQSLSRYRLLAGDLLFSRMATVGRAGLVTKSLEGALVNYHLMRLRLDPSLILAEFFLAYVRGSEKVRDYIRKVNHGATRDGINTEQLLALPVDLPPLPEQQRIVAEVERRLSLTHALETAVDHSLKRAERLRQSVLKRAFEGRLVPQDPNDEPASLLLERIRAERSKTQPVRRARRAKAGAQMALREAGT
jgi:type I restriction enzyme S subunit